MSAKGFIKRGTFGAWWKEVSQAEGHFASWLSTERIAARLESAALNHVNSEWSECAIQAADIVRSRIAHSEIR